MHRPSAATSGGEVVQPGILDADASTPRANGSGNGPVRMSVNVLVQMIFFAPDNSDSWSRGRGPGGTTPAPAPRRAGPYLAMKTHP